LCLCAGPFEFRVSSLDFSGVPPNLRLRVFDLGVRVSTCDVDLLLGLRPQLFEPGSKRADLDLRRTFQFVPVFLCCGADLGQLPFGFFADVSGNLLRGSGNGSLLILCGDLQKLLGKIVQLGFEMLAQAGRRPVHRRANTIVESH
jgi:hypothetical protein